MNNFLFHLLATVNPDLYEMNLPESANVHYYKIAKIMMSWVQKFLDWLGLGEHTTLFIIIYALLVFLISFGLGLILQWLVVKIIRKFGENKNNDVFNALTSRNFFTQVCRIIPAIFFLILIQFTLTSHTDLAMWLTKLTWVYIIILLAFANNTMVDALWTRFNDKENKKKLPLKGLVTLVKGIVYIIALIIIVAIFLDKSPASLLAGLGAFAAVIMLIFKDSILGVVAGVQLSENDSLHVGDWIAAGEANGIVLEVSLTQVKIMNWDKTVSTVPPYSLVSNGFKNYRPMQESGTRLIQRSYLIDADSVVECTEEMLDFYATIPLLKDWIAGKRSQKAEGKVQDAANSAGLADGSIETNLGVFRAYLNIYLAQSSEVDHSPGPASATFVTTLAQTGAGIPLQLYFFTSTSSWIPYEAIGASIFEHIAVMMGKFKLLTFSYPTGRDLIIDGSLSGGRLPEINNIGIPLGILTNQGPTMVPPQNQPSVK